MWKIREWPLTKTFTASRQLRCFHMLYSIWEFSTVLIVNMLRTKGKTAMRIRICTWDVICSPCTLTIAYSRIWLVPEYQDVRITGILCKQSVFHIDTIHQIERYWIVLKTCSGLLDKSLFHFLWSNNRSSLLFLLKYYITLFWINYKKTEWLKE